MTVTKLLADSLINFKILFQKILELIVFLILWSSLFHSITVDIKKEISLCFKERDVMHISGNRTRAS